MIRASLIFSYLIVLLFVVIGSTVYYGIQTGEIRTKIINPIKSAAISFSQAALIPESNISPPPMPTLIPIKPKVDPAIVKRNTYNQAINTAHNSWAEGKDSVVINKAAEALENAQTDEEKAVAHYWLALGNYRQGNDTVAEKEDNLALTLDPKYAAPYTTLSAISMNKGDYQKALTLAQKAAVLDPTYPWAYNNQGIALVELGRKAEGLEMFRKAIKLSPDSYIFKDNLNRAEQAD
jgi:tetratricopeptide (TPR) repeat protein